MSLKFDMTEEHPDRNCVESLKGHEVNDVYKFDASMYTLKEAIEHAMYDLAITAGGGYNFDHITNIKPKIGKIYTFEE